MVKYRVTIDQNLCISCGIASGSCPPHARTLSRLLDEHQNEGDILEGIISEELYSQVKNVTESCPVHAINLERIPEEE